MFRRLAQINHAPFAYSQTGWAIASDEKSRGNIDYEVVRAISINPLIADYPGEDFYAYIWHIDGWWIGEVWNQGEEVGVEYEATVDKIVSKIRRKYGQQ